MDSAFTDAEKRLVLAEMIKVSQIDISTLIGFVRDQGLAMESGWPGWREMQLPNGRNIRQCHGAAEAMFNMRLPTPTLAPLKRKSLEDLNEQPPKRPEMMPLVDMQQHQLGSFGSVGPGPVQFQPRPQTWQNTHSHTLPQIQTQQMQPVNIQPRPSPNGHLAVPSPPLSSKPLPPRRPARLRPPTGRRRGRPSKADIEARANAAQPQSTAYTPISHAQAVAAMSTTPHQHTFNFSPSQRPAAPNDATTHRALSSHSIPETASRGIGTSPGPGMRHKSEDTPSLGTPAAAAADPRGEHTAGNTYRYAASSWRESVLQPETSPTLMEPRRAHDSPSGRLQQPSYLPPVSAGDTDTAGSLMGQIKRENYPSIIEPSPQ